MCKDALWMRDCRVRRMCNSTLPVRRTILREEQFVASERTTFSVVFLKMDFVRFVPCGECVCFLMVKVEFPFSLVHVGLIQITFNTQEQFNQCVFVGKEES